MQIRPNYIVDNQNNKIAVQLDIDTYEKISAALEKYALVKLIDENEKSDKLELDEAKKYYQSLKSVAAH